MPEPCPILCGGEITHTIITEGVFYFYQCPRCGNFRISKSFLKHGLPLLFKNHPEASAKISQYIKRWNREHPEGDPDYIFSLTKEKANEIALGLLGE